MISRSVIVILAHADCFVGNDSDARQNIDFYIERKFSQNEKNEAVRKEYWYRTTSDRCNVYDCFESYSKTLLGN